MACKASTCPVNRLDHIYQKNYEESIQYIMGATSLCLDPRSAAVVVDCTESRRSSVPAAVAGILFDTCAVVTQAPHKHRQQGANSPSAYYPYARYSHVASALTRPPLHIGAFAQGKILFNLALGRLMREKFVGCHVVGIRRPMILLFSCTFRANP